LAKTKKKRICNQHIIFKKRKEIFKKEKNSYKHFLQIMNAYAQKRNIIGLLQKAKYIVLSIAFIPRFNPFENKNV
jgi:hypothetical protein